MQAIAGVDKTCDTSFLELDKPAATAKTSALRDYVSTETIIDLLFEQRMDWLCAEASAEGSDHEPDGVWDC